MVGKDTKNDLIKHQPESITAFELRLKEAERVAKYIVDSDTFGDNFSKTVEVIVAGETQLAKVKNPNDVVACILLGQSLGLDPMEAITMGKQINASSYLQIMKGKALGLDLTSSLQNINILPGKGGSLNYYTNISVVQKAVLDTGTYWEVIEDFKPVDRVFEAKTGAFLADDYDDKEHFLVTKGITADTINKEKANGKVGVTIKKDRRTTILFTRTTKAGTQTSKGTFTLSEATDAELYRGHKIGYDDKGEQATFYIAGKDNWNNRPRQMLYKQAFMIGARPICADKLQGIIEESELTNVEVIDTNAEIIEVSPTKTNPVEDTNEK